MANVFSRVPSSELMAAMRDHAEMAGRHPDSADLLRELAQRLEAAEAAKLEIASVRRFALLKSKQFADQAFGDARVEFASGVLEDVAHMLGRLL